MNMVRIRHAKLSSDFQMPASGAIEDAAIQLENDVALGRSMVTTGSEGNSNF